MKRGYKKVRMCLREFTSFLMEGWPILRAAKKLGISKPTAYRWAHLAVEEKLIEPVCKWPLLYRKALKFSRASRRVGRFSHLSYKDPIFIPHKFGGTFLQTGRPDMLYDEHGRASDKQGNYTIQFGRNKTTIWIMHFRGRTVDSILKNALEDMIRIAEFEAAKRKITLTLERIYDGVEWIVADKSNGAELSKIFGIRVGEQKRIAQTIFKNGDASHPNLLEINKAPNQPANQPTNVVREFEYMVNNYRKHDTLIRKDILEIKEALILSAKRSEVAHDAIMTLHKRINTLAPEPPDPPKKFGEKPEGNDYR